MLNVRVSCLVAAAAAVCVSLGTQVAHADPDAAVTLPRHIPGESTTAMSRYFLGTHGKVGVFPGKLVCLRCDVGPAPRSKCSGDHRHALVMDDGDMVHPLIAETPETLEMINSDAMHGSTVRVHGKYYMSSGAIFVNRVDKVPGADGS